MNSYNGSVTLNDDTNECNDSNISWKTHTKCYLKYFPFLWKKDRLLNFLPLHQLL